MSANFTPTLHTYKMQGAFRYWVQKVLPLVYDDSLSYYELLNKVVDYLNKMMEDENNLIEDVESLRDAFVSLQNYVNDYFDNLDLSDVVEQKVNDLLDSGALQEMIDNYFMETTEFVHRLDQKVNVYNSDTGWSELTLADGVTAFSDSTKPAVRKIGNCVYMRGAIFGLSANRKTIATLPDWALPSVNVEFPVLVSLATTEPFSNGFALMSVGADSGDVVYRSYVGSSAEMMPVWLDYSWLVAADPEYPEVFTYKGTVADFESLPPNALVGDVYTVTSTDNEYVWTGSAWSLFAVSDVIQELQDDVEELQNDSEVVNDILQPFSAPNILYDKSDFSEDIHVESYVASASSVIMLPFVDSSDFFALPTPFTGGFYIFDTEAFVASGNEISSANVTAKLKKVHQSGGAIVADMAIDPEPTDWTPVTKVWTGTEYQTHWAWIFEIPSSASWTGDDNAWVIELTFAGMTVPSEQTKKLFVDFRYPWLVKYTGTQIPYALDYIKEHWSPELNVSNTIAQMQSEIEDLRNTIATLQLDAMPQLSSSDIATIIGNVN